MPGFASYDQIIDTLTVQGKGQEIPFVKQPTGTFTTGIFQSFWPMAGHPSAGGYGSSLVARAVDGNTAGALRFTNPSGAETLHLLSIGGAPTGFGGTLYVFDRLMDYAGLDHASTSLQTLGAGTLPRYDGVGGVMMFMEQTSASMATGAQNATIVYTNHAGTGSRTTTEAMRTANLNQYSLCHSGLFIPLQAGDSGVKSVQTVQFSAARTAANASALVLVKLVATLPLITVNAYIERDMALQTPKLFKVINDAAQMFLWLPASSTAPTMIAGSIAGASR